MIHPSGLCRKSRLGIPWRLESAVITEYGSRRARSKKKTPAPPCGIIYLNLVTKGVPCTPLQAIKFPKEKLAHRAATWAPIK
jgi:hypothetical protein